MTTVGKPITCRAAVCWEANQPVAIEDVIVSPPKAGEVRIQMKAVSMCQTDFSALKGYIIHGFFEGAYPVVIGHEGVGVVESVGSGVTTMQPGDHVIPLFGKRCNRCTNCVTGSSNLCAETKGNSLMADGTTRLSAKGKALHQIASLGTFAEYTVCAEDSVAKVNPSVPMKHLSPMGCCVPTGLGSALRVAGVTPGSVCAIWGLGGVGLAAVLGCRLAGAATIVGVDINPAKEAIGRKMGCTDFVNPATLDKPIAEYMMERFAGGCDFTFESVGNVNTMMDAYESARYAGGLCVIIGGAPQGKKMSVSPGDLLMDRRLKGSLFGGYKFRGDLPQLVDMVASGQIPMDDFVTHDFQFERIHEAVELMKTGQCIRAALHF